ncbi:unnamed protein product, partial [Prorocentrum cordatum]
MTDAQSRMVAMKPKLMERGPFMMMFGFGDAFPSVCRTSLSRVLKTGGLPYSVLNIVDAICVFPLAWANLGGVLQVFCWLAFGTLQGRPWSGALWAAGVGPIVEGLFVLARHFKQRVIGVCADDVGAVLPSTQIVHPLSSVFFAAEHLVHLAFSAGLELRVKVKLAELAPRWADMQVAPAAEYLGVLLYPSVTNNMRWQKVVAGWKHAARAIASAGAPASAPAQLCNQRAVTKASYMAQLLSWPSTWRRKNRGNSTDCGIFFTGRF